MSKTFESEARRIYGDDAHAKTLRQANPGVAEPIPPGVDLVAPGAPELPAGQYDAADGAVLVIAGVRFRFWTSVAYTAALDSIDTVEFVAPWDPTDPQYRAFFRPLAFQPVQFLINGVKVFDGVSLGPTLDTDGESHTVAVRAYARCGVLEDCTLPASALPFEFEGLNFRQVAERVCALFGVPVTVQGDAGAVYAEDGKIALDPSDTALDFLAELARERGFILGSDANGGLVARSVNVTPGAVVATLDGGTAPVVRVSVQFQPQQYYSHLTAFAAADLESEGGQHTARNDRLQVLRPHNFIAKEPEETAKEARAAMGRMFANVCTYTLELSTWRTPAGQIWAPGMFVSLVAPLAMCYAPYTFLVRAVTLTGDPGTQSATLELVITGAFTGEAGGLPWGA